MSFKNIKYAKLSVRQKVYFQIDFASNLYLTEENVWDVCDTLNSKFNDDFSPSEYCRKKGDKGFFNSGIVTRDVESYKKAIKFLIDNGVNIQDMKGKVIKEGAEAIMNKKISNPDTGRKVKVSSALGYKDGSTVKQKAQALLNKLKGNSEGTKEGTESPEGKVPEKDRKKVVAILDKLKAMSDEASAKGEKAPDYDLCKVAVPGTNLFCQVSLDIPRAEMPQLKGNAIPGTPADDLPKDKNGEVDTEAAFKKALEASGAKMTPKKIDASTLKATQSQLVGAKVAGMTAALKKEPNHEAITAPIFVSKDGYILDGHHRWAAQVGLSLNQDKPVMMNVVEVDMDAKSLVDFTNKFCNDIGIKQKAGKIKEAMELKEVTDAKLISSIMKKVEKSKEKEVKQKEMPKLDLSYKKNYGTNGAMTKHFIEVINHPDITPDQAYKFTKGLMRFMPLSSLKIVDDNELKKVPKLLYKAVRKATIETDIQKRIDASSLYVRFGGLSPEAAVKKFGKFGRADLKESYLNETTPMKKQIKLSEAIAAIEKMTGKKLQLVESDCYDAPKMSLTEEFTTADIAVPEAPALEPMKKGTKLNNDADYLAEGEQECLTEDIPASKVSAEEPKEGFQKLKSLASQFKMHLEESSIKTVNGVQKSYAITFPKKFQITYTFAFKLNKLGYTMVVDSMGKYKLHIIQNPATK